MGFHAIFSGAKPAPVLDIDFDEDGEFEVALLGYLARHGSIGLHPNGWGVHDGQFAGCPEDNRSPEERKKYREQVAVERAKRTELAAEAARKQRDECHLLQRRINSRVSRRQTESIRTNFARFLLKNDPFTREALRNSLEPIVKRYSRDQVEAVCAINEFMDFGWKQADATGMTYRKWFANQIKSYHR